MPPPVRSFGRHRRDLPLWLWKLLDGSFVVFRPGWWPDYRGVAFARVLGDATTRGASREFDVPAFRAEVWFPADPIDPGKRAIFEVLSNRSVLRYVSEPETTLLALPRSWLDEPEQEPLPERLLRAIFDSPGASAA